MLILLQKPSPVVFWWFQGGIEVNYFTYIDLIVEAKFCENPLLKFSVAFNLK